MSARMLMETARILVVADKDLLAMTGSTDVDPDGVSRGERSVHTGQIETGNGPQTAGDPLPPDCELIEVRVAEFRQLFNVIEASSFRERDLDPDSAEFIVGWAREARETDAWVCSWR